MLARVSRRGIGAPIFPKPAATSYSNKKRLLQALERYDVLCVEHHRLWLSVIVLVFSVNAKCITPES